MELRTLVQKKLLQGTNKCSVMLLPDRVWNNETLVDMGAAHMDENERSAQDENVDYKVSTPDYGELIIEMVGKINDENFLRRMYISLRDYLKEKAG